MNHRQLFGAFVKENLQKYGLDEWEYSYNERLKRTLGKCWHGIKMLEFSLAYVDNNPMEVLQDTVLHEIAHALVGPGQKHNEIWKAKAREIGAVDRSCSTFVIDIPVPYMFLCPCGVVGKFYRRPTYMKRRCNRCGYVGEVTATA